MSQFTLPQQYTRYAEELRRSAEYAVAGDYYLAASRGWLMRYRALPDDRPQSTMPAISRQNFARGIQDRLTGVICYQLGGQDERAESTCEQGISIIRDVMEYDNFVGDDDENIAREGLLHEMLGDFRLISHLDSYEQSYDEAKNCYEQVSNHWGWQAEPEFDSLIRLTVDLADAAGFGFEEQSRESVVHGSLLERIDYKKRNYEEVVEEVLAAGEWTT